MKKKYKLIILDFDGTLAYLPVDWSKLKLDLSTAFHFVSFKSLTTGINQLKAMHDAKHTSQCYAIISQHEQKDLSLLTVNQKAIQFIMSNQYTYPFAICSSNLRGTIDKSLEHIGLQSHIDMVVGNEDVKQLKPDPEGLLKICSRFNTPPQDTLFIGDHVNDAAAAKRASTAYHHPSEISRLYPAQPSHPVR